MNVISREQQVVGVWEIELSITKAKALDTLNSLE